MNLTKLIERFRALTAYDLDPIGPFPMEDDPIVAFLNQAQDELARRAKLTTDHGRCHLTVGKADYPLTGSAFDRRYLRIDSVRFNGEELERRAPTELDRRFPGWRKAEPGSPKAFHVTSAEGLVVVPAPSGSAVLAGPIEVSGAYLPAILSLETPTQEVDLPAELHPHVAALAVVFAAEPQATEPSQRARLERMRAEAFAAAATVRDAQEAERVVFLPPRARRSAIAV